MIATEMSLNDVPALYERFAKEVGESHWRNRLKNIKSELRGNSLLKSFFAFEYGVVIQLCTLGDILTRRGYLPVEEADYTWLYPAISTCGQLMSLMDVTSKENAVKLKRRFHDAIANPSAMRGLQLELSAATHFVGKGCGVSWPEMVNDSQIGSFDLLVDIGEGLMLEVECKSVGEDKGRRISRREIIDFGGLLKNGLQSRMEGLTTGLVAVLTVSDKLPNHHRDRVDLAKALTKAIFVGSSCTLQDGSSVRIEDFDTSGFSIGPDNYETQSSRDLLNKITNTDNRSAVLMKTEAGGVLVVAVQSQKDDSFMKALFSTLSDAAKRQLTGTRAGLLVVGLEGITSSQLISVAEDDDSKAGVPSNLQVEVSRFLNSDARNHLIGVGFLSRGQHERFEDGFKGFSTTYHFHKTESPFWSDQFHTLFGAGTITQATAAPSSAQQQPG